MLIVVSSTFCSYSPFRLLLLTEPEFGVLLDLTLPELEVENVGVDAVARVYAAEVGINVNILVLLDKDLGEVGIDC